MPFPIFPGVRQESGGEHEKTPLPPLTPYEAILFQGSV
jgi:hypothetical protein